MAIKKRLLAKSLLLSFVITVFLMLLAYIPISSLMTEKEKSVFVTYAFLSSLVIFFILIAVFYFDIRRILERKS